MIDLRRTREELLLELGVSQHLEPRLPSDADTSEAEAFALSFQDAAPEPLLVTLNAMLKERLRLITPERLSRDVLLPLKKAVGNAWKHGNRRDDAKRIQVLATFTRLGVLIEVSDDGDGFDVQGVLGKYAAKERYFNHRGSGFKNYNNSLSIVSFANGGRTVMIQFFSEIPPDEALGILGDARTVTPLLASRVRVLREHRAVIDSVRVLTSADGLPSSIDVAYEITSLPAEGGAPRRMVLAGRLLPELAARAEIAGARALRRGSFSRPGIVRIPRPVGVLPGLVLFAATPRGDFAEHLAAVDPQVMTRACEGVGIALRRVHASDSANGTIDTVEMARSRMAGTFARIEAALVPTSPERAARARAQFLQLDERMRSLGSWPTATIHGTFGWDCLAGDSTRIDLFGFNASCRSHPGLDLGGFLTDLRRHFVLRKKADKSRYAPARDAFLGAYFRGSRPSWRGELAPFIASALMLRLERLLGRESKKWEQKVDSLLDDWELLLGRD